MRQKRVHKTTAAPDDGLPPVGGVGQQLSADTIVIARASGDAALHASADGCTYAFTIRDSFSGLAAAVPQRHRTLNNNYAALKHFQGAYSLKKPDIVVKSDAAAEITGAVRDLGWHSEPALPGRWPHNAAHERWIGTFKSVVRAAMLQS